MKITNYRDRQGKFTRKSRFAKVILTLAAISLVVTAIVHANNFVDADADYMRAEEVQKEAGLMAEMLLGKKLEKYKVEQQDKILATLQQCESGGYDDPDGIIIMDSNDKHSIGRFQWQKASVIYYMDKFYGKDITHSEAIAIAIDEERVTELTRKVLFKQDVGWKNWYNCSKRHNLKEKISIVNEL